MEIILFIVLPIVFGAFCVWLRFQPIVEWRHQLGFGALMVVVVGSVLGRDFFAVHAGPFPVTIDRAMLGMFVALFAFWMLAGSEEIRFLNGLDLAVLFWVSIVCLSTLTHDWGYSKKTPLTKMIFFLMFFPFILYLLARHSKLNLFSLKASSVVLPFMGVYLALTAVFEVKGISVLVFPGYIMTSDFTEFFRTWSWSFSEPYLKRNFHVSLPLQRVNVK